MRNITKLLILFITPIAFGQTNHTVSTLNNSFVPNNLTIDAGDSVTFFNGNQGLHNLNGSQATFPDNPESFGMLVSSQSWTYGHRFMWPGVYDYRCDVHSAMMIGQITVLDNLGVNENITGVFSFYPNPVNDKISITTKWTNYDVYVYNMMGEEVLSKHLLEEYTLDLSVLQSGMYLIQISSGDEFIQERLVKN